MAIETKTVLKSHFPTGGIPTETHFASLIDTMVTLTPGLSASVQIGTGANITEDSIQIGNGINVRGVEPIDPDAVPNGTIWLDSFGIITIKTNGRVLRFK